IWSKLADWYLEIVKVDTRNNAKPDAKPARENSQPTTHYNPQTTTLLIYVLETILKLCHPFMPFVTEQIWTQMGHKTMLMTEKFPEVKKRKSNSTVNAQFGLLQKIISDIRNYRSENKVEPQEKISAVIIAGDSVVAEHSEAIKVLARVADLKVEIRKGKDYEIKIDRPVDVEKEKNRLNKEKENLTNYVAGLEKKLGNSGFVDNAPATVVEAEKAKLVDAKEKLSKVVGQLENLK
ncbi:MAG: class I tRNA ligase family protein, partial [Parcubacteria group bacterium]